jgi:hypothetical protein
VTFTPNAPYVGFPINTEDNLQRQVRYEITVSGTAPDAIRDTDNLVLDGDGDGRAGGNKTSSFIVKPPPPLPVG